MKHAGCCAAGNALNCVLVHQTVRWLSPPGPTVLPARLQIASLIRRGARPAVPLPGCLPGPHHLDEGSLEAYCELMRWVRVLRRLLPAAMPAACCIAPVAPRTALSSCPARFVYLSHPSRSMQGVLGQRPGGSPQLGRSDRAAAAAAERPPPIAGACHVAAVLTPQHPLPRLHYSVFRLPTWQLHDCDMWDYSE